MEFRMFSDFSNMLQAAVQQKMQEIKNNGLNKLNAAIWRCRPSVATLLHMQKCKHWTMWTVDNLNCEWFVRFQLAHNPSDCP